MRLEEVLELKVSGSERLVGDAGMGDYICVLGKSGEKDMSTERSRLRAKKIIRDVKGRNKRIKKEPYEDAPKTSETDLGQSDISIKQMYDK